jgi:hypothetical protein
MIKIQKLHFKQLAIQASSKLAESESQVSFSNIERFGGYNIDFQGHRSKIKVTGSNFYPVTSL